MSMRGVTLTLEPSTGSSDQVAAGPVVLIPPFRAGAQGDSRMQLRWCLRDGLVEELASRQAWRPYLLIVVTAKNSGGMPRHKEGRRYLVPLDQYEQTIWFDYAGDNEIFAVPVWHEEGFRKLWRRLMRKNSSGYYENDLIDPYEGGFVRFLGVSSISESSSLAVHVDAKLFGKEPPKWLLGFVRRFYAQPLGRVECDFRKHLIGTLMYRFWLSLVVVPLIWLLDGLIVAGLNILGLRGINYDPFRHPYTMTPKQIWAHTSGSRWFKDRAGEPRPVWFLVLNPLVFLCVAGVWYFIGWLAGLGWIWPLVATVATFVALPFLLLPLAGMVGAAITARLLRRQENREAEERRRAAELRESLQVLACDRFTERPETLTISLRWNRLKARVCRPYAKAR